MEHELARILGKPNDYKLCATCNIINWYENKICHNCGWDKFNNIEEDIIEWAHDEYDYWLEHEGYEENEIDNILIEI